MTACDTRLDPRDPVDVCSEPADDEPLLREIVARFVDKALTGVNACG